MRHSARIGLVVLAALLAVAAGAQPLTQNFDDITLMPGAGWVFTNNSNPVGSTGWFQGNTAVFSSQAGAANSYMAANFNAAGFGGNISLWALSPTLTNLQNGEVLTFYTRTETAAPAPDRLEVRVSVAGASTNVGATDASVGDFTSLLLAINPTLAGGGYPATWTLYSVTLTGLPVGPNSGRIGFRYFVTDTSVNGDYIGIDTLALTGPPNADLAITKTADTLTPALGNQVTFTLTVTNAGPATASNVTVTDLLPAGLQFMSATPSQGSYNSITGVWTVGTVAPGATPTLTIVATVLNTNPQTNTATVTGPDQPDPNPANNTSSVTFAGANVSIPTLGTFGIAFLVLLLGAAGLFLMRRTG